MLFGAIKGKHSIHFKLKVNIFCRKATLDVRT